MLLCISLISKRIMRVSEESCWNQLLECIRAISSVVQAPSVPGTQSQHTVTTKHRPLLETGAGVQCLNRPLIQCSRVEREGTEVTCQVNHCTVSPGTEQTGGNHDRHNLSNSARHQISGAVFPSLERSAPTNCITIQPPATLLTHPWHTQRLECLSVLTSRPS